MDASIESELAAAFAGVDGQLHHLWRLVDADSAEHVIVDMDSVTGPMHWIRLHNAGKYVIAMTVAPRSRTQYQLERPVSVGGLTYLLQGIARSKGLIEGIDADSLEQVFEPEQPEPARAPQFNEDAIAGIDAAVIEDLLRPKYPKIAKRRPGRSRSTSIARQRPSADDLASSAAASSQGPPGQMATSEDHAPQSHPASDPTHSHSHAHIHTAPPAARDRQVPVNTPVSTPATTGPDAQPAGEEESVASPAPAEAPDRGGRPSQADDTRLPEAGKGSHAPHASPGRAESGAARGKERRARLARWLQPGMLEGRLRLRSSRAPTLYIDTQTRQYYGPATLKPLTGAFEGDVDSDEFEALSAASWQREIAMLGPPRPLSRLQWYAALLGGRGRLATGSDPDGRYQLVKWPETEREFPRHFRIATAMMKGPATLQEIADASSATLAEVADFINATVVSGHTAPVDGVS